MTDAVAVCREAQSLNPVDRLKLVEMLLADLDQPDDRIDALWAKEAQGRWEAFRRGELNASRHESVRAKYQRA
ncbi:MAG TPA: addiction module protein [Nitrospira sp.]|nr:addiction module protein [Nitrospira sp.]